jgi:hypothetical protein
LRRRVHAPANRLIQARASLKELLSETDIEFLVDYDDAAPLWSVGATQRNSRIDQFLSGLGIREWGLFKFIETLRKGTRDEDRMFPVKPDATLLSWLKQKPAAWMQELYALLQAEAGSDAYGLEKLCIVRLADSNLSRGDQAFFANGTTAGDIPVVDAALYTSGASKSQQEGAKKFLSEIGVREIGEAEQVELILKRRYTQEAPIPDDASYQEDLRRFVALVEKEPNEAALFGEFYIFQGEGDAWHVPEGIYLDRPYMDTGLSAYFGAVSPDDMPTALHARYLECGIETKKLSEFAKAVGAKASLEIREDICNKNPERQYLYSAGGSWSAYGINRDYFIPHLDEILKSPSLELSRLIWRTLRVLPANPNYLQATFRCNASHNAHYAASRLVHELRTASWVPQGDQVFVRPTEALRELLPKGFAFDPGDSWLKAIQFGETAARRSAEALEKDAAARSLGFADAAAAERARRFNDLPQSEQEKILSEFDNRSKSAIPDRPLANPERRAQNVREQALQAPDKQSEIRERSVSIGREDVKEQADLYLREHYRNADGEVTWQICKGPLPFKLDDGREYFEVVEFLPELTKRHLQNYLALCPNHSAMFRFVNRSSETIREAFQTLTDNELAVLLAEQDLTIYFSKTHIIDLNAVLDVEDSLLAAPNADK